MKVVILCGGQGTRLREETEYRPKPMVEVGGRPILWHIMKTYAYYGYKDFVLCLGYKGEMIKEYFLNYEDMNCDFTIQLNEKRQIKYYDNHNEADYQVTLVNTGQDTMTGGRVKRVAKYLDDVFMVTYGDGVSNINIQNLVNFHRSHGKLATITSVKPVSRFGVLTIDEEGCIQNFSEKPQGEGWINAGFMVFNKKVLEYLDGDETILEREPLERLTRDKQIMAFRHEGFFYAMDTYREYLYLSELWQSGKAPWKVD